MRRRTVLCTQVVVEERVRLSRRQIRKRIKLQRAIASGINIAVMTLTAVVIVTAVVFAWNTLQARTGMPGGEILMLPALVFAFWWGLQVGSAGDDYQEDADDGRFVADGESHRRA